MHSFKVNVMIIKKLKTMAGLSRRYLGVQLSINKSELVIKKGTT